MVRASISATLLVTTGVHAEAVQEASGLALQWAWSMSTWQAPGHALPARTPQLADNEPRWAVDASLDQTTRHGASRDAAVTWAWGRSMDQSGMRARVAFNRSMYRYPEDAARARFIEGRSQQVDIMVGGAWVMPGLSLTLLAGYSAARADEGDFPTFRDTGTKTSLSVYAAPSPDWRLFSSLSYTHMSRYTQLYAKLGRTVEGGAFWGPELKFEWRGGAPWSEELAAWRVGGHVSGLPLAGAWLSLSIGQIRDRGVGQGGYAGLGLYGSY